MEVSRNFPLKSFNTFSVDVKARYFAQPKSIPELIELTGFPDFEKLNKLVIGGGSNILFTTDYNGIVILPAILGKSILKQDNDFVYIGAGAGEDWDSFVSWCIHNGFGGLENLSLIPGTVGACPVQNIGAYGVEVGDLIERVYAFDISSAKMIEFSGAECNFTYRNSIFKSEYKDKLIITSVVFRLFLKPQFKINYGAVADELSGMGGVTLETVRQAIINIRKSKLPDPKIIPNAGSFFKNPSVSKDVAEQLRAEFPDIICYDNVDGSVKIAAGWLIDHLGWKGKKLNGAAVHEKQALVLINEGNASGQQILELALKIKESVLDKFRIDLEFEVNIF